MGKNICIYNWEREGDAILFLRKEMVDSSVLEFILVYFTHLAP